MLRRLALAIVAPRWALAIAGDRRHAGRSGSDLMLALAVVLVATSLRFLVEAAAAGVVEDAGFGLRLLLGVMTSALTVPLGFLVVSAAVIWLRHKELGRAFDLASVAVLPFLLIDLAGRSIAFAFHLPVPRIVVVILTGAAFAWSGALVAQAMMLRGSRSIAPPDKGGTMRWVLVALALLGLAGQGVWIATHADELVPMRVGKPAPAFQLPRVADDGSLGPQVALASLKGKTVVLDFWATWCKPCLASMPKLDAFAKAHPEVAVLAINTDDAHEARALFKERGYGLDLVADEDGAVGTMYRVQTIPHTVVVDPQGMIRAQLSGSGHDLEKFVKQTPK